MIIQHNMLAMNANRMYNSTVDKQKKSTEKLSSGYKINRSADDAAGLAISEKMRRQIRGLTQASQNAEDGISLVQIADAAMAEVHDMLHRGTELSIKAANDTLTDQDRGYIQEEIEQLKKEIDQIKEKATFNEICVLKGKDVEVQQSNGGAAVVGGLPAWVGIGGSALADGYMSDTYTTTESYQYTDSSGNLQSGSLAVDHSAVTLDFDFGGQSPAQMIADLTKPNSGFYSTCCTCSNHYSIQFVNGGGNSQNKSGNHTIFKVDISGVASGKDVVDRVLAAVGNNPNGHYTKLTSDGGSKLTVYDNRDKSSAVSALKTSIKTAGGTGLTWTSWSGTGKGDHASASKRYGVFGPGIAVDGSELENMAPTELELQVGAEAGQLLKIKLPSISCGALKISDVDVTTTKGAANAINSFKAAIGKVSEERSRMGAYQNRLEHTIRNLDNVVENTTAAESAIRDTDMAKEMVQSSTQNILAQAGISMLSQANQSSQGVLSIIG